MIFRSPHPSVPVPEVPFAQAILDRAGTFGDKPALIDGPSGRTTSFSELADRVRRLAGGLRRAGLRRGDVIAFLCPNCPEFGLMFLASSLAGATITTLNPALTPGEISGQLDDSGARFAFTIPSLCDRISAGPDLPRVVFVLGEAPGATPYRELMDSPPLRPDVAIDPARDIAALPYSSGTTGLPKGVMLTHRNLVANLVQIDAAGVFETEDTIVGVLPFFHIYGMTVILGLGLYKGATNVTLPRFDVDAFVGIVEGYGVTHANLVPPILVGLAKHPGVDPKRLASLARVQSGAAPLGADTARLFAGRFDCRVLQGYGMTEASPVTHVVPREWASVPVDSVGPLVPDTECRIVHVENGRTLGSMERGELQVRGPQVMKGYWNQPDETAAILDADGWLRTGDIGYADADGNTYIVDRVKELIKYKGYSLAPAEIEEVLLAHSGIVDAAVIPSPDPAAGEVAKAFVVASERISEADVMAWVAERVAGHKKVRRVEFIDAIPKSASGKILRRVLVERERERSRAAGGNT